MSDRYTPSVGVGFPFMVGAVIGWITAPSLGFPDQVEGVSAATGVAFEGVARLVQLATAFIRRLREAALMRRQI